MKEFIKKNIWFIVILLIVIALGAYGITYAVLIGNGSRTNLNANTAPMAANVTFNGSGNGTFTSTGKMSPISDTLVTGIDVTDERVMKIAFTVSGVASNPDNTIYDIALRDANIDCALRTEDVKWRLYKNGTLLTSGNLSPSFDAMTGDRLVLTDTQQDMSTNEDSYVFLMWISESCTGDITTCTKAMDQSDYLNKNFSATIKVEMTTKAKKALVRNTASTKSCNYTPTAIPVCNTNLTYNGNSQVLMNTGTDYTLVNASGTNAGEYNVTAVLKEGFKWSDYTTDDKVINCSIAKKTASVAAVAQTIRYGESIATDNTKYTVTGLLTGHSADNVILSASTGKVGIGNVYPTNMRVKDGSNNDVTDNYKISYSGAKLTINCNNTATEPTVSNKVYNGNLQSGVTGGNNIDIDGTINAKKVGSYKFTAKPKNNYCWNDGTSGTKNYTWSITSAS